ncbi:MAG: YciK family oxidoreductase [Proteobacteria bacterium]|nr:YciK family oxidoreductase [Pseudomonadota bacterium]
MPVPIETHRYVAPANLLAGRVILITGAGSGVGRALARDCAALGATVALLGRREKPLERVYDEIVAAGGPKPALLPFDLENALAANYDALHEVLAREFGRLDGLVHCAAILGTRAPILHFDVPTWCRVLQVNLTAAFALTQACLPLLEASADASLVFTTSSVGHRGKAYWGAYAVSKFGVEGLAQVLAHEYEDRPKLRVNLVNPGPVRTDLRALAYPAEDATRLAGPEAVTATYLYLLGPDAAGVSGQRFECQP